MTARIESRWAMCHVAVVVVVVIGLDTLKTFPVSAQYLSASIMISITTTTTAPLAPRPQKDKICNTITTPSFAPIPTFHLDAFSTLSPFHLDALSTTCTSLHKDKDLPYY